MANKKRDIGKGIDGLFGGSSQNGKKSEKTKKEQMPVNKKATFYLAKDDLDKLKALAWYERKPIKAVVEEALSGHFKGRRAKVSRALSEYSAS